MTGIWCEIAGVRIADRRRFADFLFILMLYGLSLLLGGGVLAEEARETIQKISVRGNNRVAEETVLLQLSSEVGDVFEAEVIEKDIKEIYRTGFFEQVEANRGAGGELIFKVSEKRAIRKVLLEGRDEVGEETLLEKLGSERWRFYDSRKVAQGLAEAKVLYQSKGFYDATLEQSVEDVGEGSLDLTISIDEGEKKFVREIVFDGVEQVDLDEIEDRTETKTYRWWSSWLTSRGTLQVEVAKDDSKRITQYYLDNGYVDVRVGNPEISEVEDGLKLVYKIVEGSVYNFGDLGVEGDLFEGSLEKTIEDIPVSSGEVFSASKLREAAFAITEKFSDQGFAFANVTPHTFIDRENNVVNIDFKVDKGNEIYIDRINIVGNEKSRDNVIRRTLRIQEQERYSGSRVRRSQELLQRLGYFDEVSITSEPTADEDKVDLNVSVREGNTGTFSIGAGVSSGDGLIFSGRISESNIFGSGNSLTLDIDSGSRRDNFVLSFDNPAVNDGDLSFGIDGLAVEREFDSFDRSQAGGSISFGYPLWFLDEESRDDYRFSLAYQLLRVKIDEVDDDAPQLILDAEGKTTSSSVTPRLVRNTINNPLDPEKGSRQTISVELAGIGGNEKFWLAQASNTFYYPLIESSWGPIVFSNRVSIGWGDTFDSDDFPLFRRFFLGGINSVRGFESRELAPKDDEGNEFGGSKQFTTNVELIFPLVPSMGLKAVTFFDTGNSFDDDQSLEFGELRHAFGWGLRWRSPIAPIRIEFGYPIDKEEGEKSVVTHFSFGSPL